MEKHDIHCADADVGSICDCECAGSKHAILHTVGGVPGAGAVTHAAQKAAHEAGRTAVVNNRAVPKQGAKVSPSAPKAFKDERAAREAEKAKKSTPAAGNEPKPVEKAEKVDGAVKKPADSAEKKPPADSGKVEVASRRRNGDTVAETATKTGHDVSDVKPLDEQPKPAGKVPAALRDVLDVVKNPDPVPDVTAAARYQKLTPEHLKQMTPEQKQTMLDDIRSRVKRSGYTKKHATGQKLERGYNTLVHGDADVKKGMKAADNFHASGNVTHPEFGHGKVVKNGGSAGATVDFGDRTETVPQASLTFGHTAGADVNGDVKAAAYAKRDTEKASATLDKGKKSLTDFADRLNAHIKAVKENDHFAKAQLGTRIGAGRKEYSALGEFNNISGMKPETFQALPPEDQQKVRAAVEHLGKTHRSIEVQHRVNDTLHAWTGKGVDVTPEADPAHVVDAKKRLAGQGTALPTSMVYGQISDHSLKQSFTPQERATMRTQSQRILAAMKPDAPDRAGLQGVVKRIDAIDGPDDTAEGLMARAKAAERESMNPALPMAQRQEHRNAMHDLEKKAFALQNPERTPGPGANMFRGKPVKPVTENQAPVLEAIASGSGYRSLPAGPVRQLEQTKHIQTVFSGGGAHLTELGHQKVAAQRGDVVHQQLNEKVAQRYDELQQAAKVRQLHTESRGKDPLEKGWSRRSQEVQHDEQQAYGRWQMAINARNEHAAGGGRPPAEPAPSGERDKSERVISRDPATGGVTDTAKPADKPATPPAGGSDTATKPADSPALAAKRAELAEAERQFNTHGNSQAASGNMRSKRFGQQVNAHIKRTAALGEKVKQLRAQVNALEHPPAASEIPDGGFKPEHLAGKRFVKTRFGWHEIDKVNRTTVKLKTEPGPGNLESVPMKKIIAVR